MIDTEWAACDDTRRMLEALRGKATPRKLRLLACATARCLSRVAVDPVCLKTLAVAERYADGGVTEQERDDAFTVAGHHSDEVEPLGFERWAFACLASFAVGSLAGDVQTHVTSVGLNIPTDFGGHTLSAGQDPECMEVQATTIREIFGDPFRPATLSPAHRTPTIVSVARAAYDERILPSGELDPERLAVLSDALEEVGAPDEVLEHLRGPGPHYRGCWVIDLILGLS